MEEEPSHMTEKILDLTLEILCLLTGETFTAVKSGDLVAIMVPPFHFMIPEITDQQKLLELTNKMLELMTAESGVRRRCTVTDKEATDKNFGTRELGRVEGHKERFKAAMMEDQPPDGSWKRNPPERSPRPPYSRDSTQETPQHDQAEDLVVVKVVDTDDEEDTCMMENQPMDGSRKRNPPKIPRSYLYSQDSMQEAHEIPHHHRVSPPERCPRPTYSRDLTQHDQEIPPHIQGEDLIVVKVGLKEEGEEPYVGGCQPSTEEVEICLNVKVGEISADVNPAQEHDTQKTSGARLTLPPDYIMGDDDIIESFPGEHSIDPNHDASRLVTSCTPRDGGNEKYSCPDCGKCLTSRYNLMIHQRVHTGERPFSCLECGRSFTRKENLQHHEKLHSGQKAFPCSKCGKCFVKPSGLIRHLRTHTVNGHKVKKASKQGLPFPPNHEVHNVQNFPGEIPAAPNLAESSPYKPPMVGLGTAEKGQFSCSMCGKCFGSNFNLQVHQRVHTGERPFSCLDCGRTFTRKENLKRHQVTHSGEKPFPCPDCGKHFTQKGSLIKHWRTHAGAGNFLSANPSSLL